MARRNRPLTNDVGDFFFPAMTPGAYLVRVEAPGFRPLESKGNVLAAAGRLALGKLQLEVGSVTESVMVTAQSAQVATTTTAQATTIDSKQMDLIVVKGRDPMSVFKTLPGVTDHRRPGHLGRQLSVHCPDVPGPRRQYRLHRRR